MRKVVLVIERLIRKAPNAFQSTSQFDIFPAPAEEAALGREIIERNCRALVLGTGTYSGPLYQALGQTGAGSENRAIIARYGVGHDGVDKALAARHGIIVTNTPGVGGQAVAEYAVCMMGCLAKNIVGANAAFKSGSFRPSMGNCLSGKTLGIIGFGNIGRRVAAIAKFGFDMRVLAVDSCLPAELQSKSDIGKVVDSSQLPSEMGIDLFTLDTDAVLKEADYLSLHLPATEETIDLIDTNRLNLLKPGAMLINTSRGTVVNETALFDALQSGRLAAAALDVFHSEPYVPTSPEKDLRTLENVILTPHVASHVPETATATAQACLKNITAFFDGRFEDLDRV